MADRTALREKMKRIELAHRHCRQSLKDGSFKCTNREAVQLVAYLLQIDNGDYNESIAKAFSTQDLLGYLPDTYGKKTSKSEKLLHRKGVLYDWAELEGVPQPQVKLRFAKACKACPTFGAQLHVVKTKLTAGAKNTEILFGLSKTDVLLVHVVSYEVLKRFEIRSLTKWEAGELSMTLVFRDNDEVAAPTLLLHMEKGLARVLSTCVTDGVKRAHSNGRKSAARQRMRSVDSADGGDSMSICSSMSTVSSASRTSALSSTSTSASSLGSLRKQAGFLQGFNRSTMGVGGGVFDDGGTSSRASSTMNTLRRRHASDNTVSGGSALQTIFTPPTSGGLASAARGGTTKEHGKAKTDDLTAFLEEASEDITTSASLLQVDSGTLRLPKKDLNEKRNAKARDQAREFAKKQILAMSAKCKTMIPWAQKITAQEVSGADTRVAHNAVQDAVMLFVTVLPPLAGKLVHIATLSSLPGRKDDILNTSGDLWIGILQLVQSIIQMSRVDVNEAAAMIALAASTLLEQLKVLTESEQRAAPVMSSSTRTNTVGAAQAQGNTEATLMAMADLRVQEAQQTHEQRLREAKSEAKRREIQQQLHAAQQAQQMAAEVAAAKRKQKFAQVLAGFQSRTSDTAAPTASRQTHLVVGINDADSDDDDDDEYDEEDDSADESGDEDDDGMDV